MRAWLADMLRAAAHRLDPSVSDGATHHLAVRADSAVAVYMDGQRLHNTLLTYKRRRGGQDLGLG